MEFPAVGEKLSLAFSHQFMTCNMNTPSFLLFFLHLEISAQAMAARFEQHVKREPGMSASVHKATEAY